MVTLIWPFSDLKKQSPPLSPLGRSRLRWVGKHVVQ
uniref:Uncharacterized protein n=1 Tax=Anguilla anguilla TaxID=7936 RepID=A0A0E9PF88_ANGAN